MKTIEIICPIPGVFYTKESPDSPVYKEPGDTIAKGETIGLIEVMKTFNQIISEQNGKLVRYEVENEAMVMVGQVLAIIETEEL